MRSATRAQKHESIFEYQRRIFDRAVEAGWEERPPSVLGNYEAECKFDRALRFVENRPAAPPQARMNASTADALLISRIATRAQLMTHVNIDRDMIRMCVTACHLNGCPLRLNELLVAPFFHFAHDVLGIVEHVSRETGKLNDHFEPRFADNSKVEL